MLRELHFALKLLSKHHTMAVDKSYERNIFMILSEKDYYATEQIAV